MGRRNHSHGMDCFTMSDKHDGGPVPNPVQIVQVNGKSSSSVWVLGDDIGAPGREYPDQPGVKSSLGAVKAGKNITIDADGTINASGGGGAVDWKDVQNKPATFAPPIATKDILGGVKPGKNLTIGADGTLDASGGSVVPATPTVLGGIKVGAGLNVTGDGTLSTAEALPDWSQITNKPATFPVAIATAGRLGGVKEGRGINIEADGTINTASAAPEWDEILNKPAAFPPPIASTNTLGGVKPGQNITVAPDGTISANIASIDWDNVVDKPTAFPPVVAEGDVVGGVKPGKNLSVDPDGTLNADILDIPIATNYLLGGVKIGAGISIAEDGTIGTEASAPYWLDIVDKPKAFPPTNAEEGVVGGIMPDDQFTVSPLGMLSAKPFKGRPNALVRYDEYGNISGSNSASYKNGELVLGGTKPVTENGQEVDAQFGGKLTLLDKTGAYRTSIMNDSFDYNLLLTNGPNVKAGFLPFVTEVDSSDVRLAFGPAKDAIGYATKDKIGLAQVGGNIDVDKAGVVSVKTATKSDRGLVKPGASIDVDADGVITPTLATFASPGIVQAGSGLEIDKNGVLSVVNPITFVNRKEVYWGNNYAKEDFWTLPDGVDYFRVTCIGQGGWGNKSGGNANTNVGGGGGGSGGWASALFFGYKFPKGQQFRLYFSGTNATYPNNAGDAWFGIDSSSPPFLAGCGGGHGEPGNSVNALANGFSQGGSGGAFDIGKSTDKYIITGYGRGQKGGNGFRVQGLSEGQTTWKTVAGLGAPSIHGGYAYGVQSGAGGGATGSGDSNGNVERQFVGGSALIVVEW